MFRSQLPWWLGRRFKPARLRQVPSENTELLRRFMERGLLPGSILPSAVGMASILSLNHSARPEFRGGIAQPMIDFVAARCPFLPRTPQYDTNHRQHILDDEDAPFIAIEHRLNLLLRQRLNGWRKRRFLFRCRSMTTTRHFPDLICKLGNCPPRMRSQSSSELLKSVTQFLVSRPVSSIETCQSRQIFDQIVNHQRAIANTRSIATTSQLRLASVHSRSTLLLISSVSCLN